MKVSEDDWQRVFLARIDANASWARRWKALARELRFNLRSSRGHVYDLHQVCLKRDADLAHLRKQVSHAVRKLEQDLEFGERSAYVEEALELLR